MSDRAPLDPSDPPVRRRFSLRQLFGWATIVMLSIALMALSLRLRDAEAELARLHGQLGYLSETEPGQIAAARAPADQPLTYKVRLRVPPRLKYRVSYSSLLPKDASAPAWYGAVPVPAGDSMLTVQIREDPRDGRWKIAVTVSGDEGTRRMATVLPAEQTRVFRGSHDVVATGIGRQTASVPAGQPIRLLDERWLVGEGVLLLYGEQSPQRDQIGVYAELQPDRGPL